MEWTVDHLTSELTRLGYPITKRRLIDWAQKGLLPHPKQRGLGRGKGSVYVWTQPGVLAQAAKVYNLLNWYGRVKHIYLPLWLLGYEIPLRVVRQKLHDWVERPLAQLAQEVGSDSSEDLTDYLSGLAAQKPRTRHVPSFLSADTARDFVEMYLNAIFNPDYEPSDEVIQEMADAFGKAGQTNSSVVSETDQDVPIIQTIRVIREHLSLPKLQETLADASDKELKRVQSDFRIVLGSLYFLVRVMNPDLADLLDRETWLWYNLIANIGPWLALADLKAHRDGYTPKINEWIRFLVDFCQRVRTDQQLQAAFRSQYRSQAKSEESGIASH